MTQGTVRAASWVAVPLETYTLFYLTTQFYKTFFFFNLYCCFQSVLTIPFFYQKLIGIGRRIARPTYIVVLPRSLTFKHDQGHTDLHKRVAMST